ncbi:MAG: hypothetical protein H7839_17380 [Magnetococcus sp. YQC-5]
MPVTYTDQEAILTATVAIEEAETLLAWLKEHGQGSVNVQGCQHLHTAVLQVLLALRPPLGEPPTDPFLKEHVWPLLQSDGEMAG